MLPTPTTSIAECRDDPPWGFCGDHASPDFGAVFAWPVAGSALKLTYDRPGRRHAATLFQGAEVGPWIVLQGRRFAVAPGGLEKASGQ